MQALLSLSIPDKPSPRQQWRGFYGWLVRSRKEADQMVIGTGSESLIPGKGVNHESNTLNWVMEYKAEMEMMCSRGESLTHHTGIR